MPTDNDIFRKVQEALVEALGVEDDEVTPEATLQGDLGAESIDFLDIIFRLEHAFEIKIPRGEMFPEDLATNPDLVQNNQVTDFGLAELRKKMPFVSFDEFARDPQLEKISELFTVNMICNYIRFKLASQEQAA